MSGSVPLIVATNAFGMGIDRADIRAVLHYDLPASLDVYCQESGRAGRDGLPAECVLLFQRRDRQLQTFFMAGRYPTREDFSGLIEALRPSGSGPLTFKEIRSSASAISASKIRVMLAVLKDADLVRERRGARYEPRPALFTDPLDPFIDAYDQRRQRDHAKLEQMIVYAQTALCRTRVLLAALGEEPSWERCGACDNCTGAGVRGAAAAEGAA